MSENFSNILDFLVETKMSESWRDNENVRKLTRVQKCQKEIPKCQKNVPKCQKIPLITKISERNSEFSKSEIEIRISANDILVLENRLTFFLLSGYHFLTFLYFWNGGKLKTGQLTLILYFPTFPSLLESSNKSLTF